ncbi:SOUL family heme-binding protein [Lysobacter panacisoli]|uniref:Heme-binding protein n=1 Tax=Lysobacter panacisoli TaxID=1255263 RepID=A0ABP9L180_9GAMM|nr:heme-binding protein [Lysobacter panacisoli]
MNGSYRHSYLDFLKSIPGFFGIRFDSAPTYHMEGIVGEVEIRRYAPALIARVFSIGEHRVAVAAARGKLVDYIDGENDSRERMGVKSPLFQIYGKSRLFNAPIRKRESPDGWTAAYFLSNSMALASAPLPDDPAITILRIPEALVAILRYRGNDTWQHRDVARRDLLDILSGSKWVADDKAYWAVYDQELSVPFLKRNEVHVPVASTC